MAEETNGKVRACKKDSEYGIIYEVPSNLSDEDKVEHAKALHKSRSKKRPYNFEYKLQS